MMTGYGHDRVVGGRHGARYFKKGQVTGAPTSAEDQALYLPQGSSLYEGFDGGPCLFREEEGAGGQWGSGPSTREGLSFTSTFFYRDWLSSELELGRAVVSAEPPESPSVAPKGGSRDAAP